MPNILPQFIQMLEKSSDLKCIQPVTKPKLSIHNYRTNEERKALEMGMSVEEAKQLDLNGQLNPGMVYLSFFFIGIQTEDSCKVSHIVERSSCMELLTLSIIGHFLNLSEHVESFEKLLHSRRTKYDDDVRWHVTAFTRKKVKDIVFSSN